MERVPTSSGAIAAATPRSRLVPGARVERARDLALLVEDVADLLETPRQEHPAIERDGNRPAITCIQSSLREKLVAVAPRIELIILEYWNVREENLEPFLAFYEDTFFRALSNCPGYAGMTVNVRSPGAAEIVLGTPRGPRKAISPHPFMHQLGTRTDAMIDFDALLQYEWNVVGMQMLTSADHLDTLWADSSLASRRSGRTGKTSIPTRGSRRT